MANEIPCVCSIWPHTSTKANSYPDLYSPADTNVVIESLILKDSLDSRVCFYFPYLPAVAADPEGILRIFWVTAATSGNLKLQVDVWAGAPETISFSQTGTGDVTSAVTDTANTASLVKYVDVDISAIDADLVQGNTVFGFIERNASSDAGDTMSANAWLVAAVLLFDA